MTEFLALDTFKAGLTSEGLIITAASVAGTAGLRIPHGTAPSAPVNGDLWTTTAGVYARVNGVTVGPLGAGGGGLDQGTADTLYVNTTGDTMTGELTIALYDMVLNSTVGNTQSFHFRNSYASRWSLSKNSAAESGGSVGSDFVIGRYNDAGAYLGDVLMITRSTGLATVAADPTANLGIATKQYVDARTPKITVATTEPGSPAVGDVWVDST